MATIKSYTDIEQSKKLAEILPLESADMSWASNGLGKPFARTIPIKGYPEELCACWSLAALLKIIRSVCNYELLSIEENKIFGVCKLEISPCRFLTEIYDNELDACCEMILKLHELNLL